MARIPQTIAVGKIHVIQSGLVVSYFDSPVLEERGPEFLTELANIHRSRDKQCSRNPWYCLYADMSQWSVARFDISLAPGEISFTTVSETWGKSEMPWFVPVTQLIRYGNRGLYYLKALYQDKFVWFTRLGADPMPICFSRIKTETEQACFIKANDRKNKTNVQ